MRGRSKPKSSMSQRLSWASIALANAVGEPEVASAIAAYGFDSNRVAQGHTLFEGASEAVSRQVAATGELRAATARAEAAEEVAFEAYQALGQVARAALKRDKPALTGLGLDKPMPRKTSLFVTMALALFDNAVGTEAIAQRLARFAYTPDRFASERAKIEALIEALRAQESAKGAAQTATAQQDAALAALDDEMGALRRIAKIALKHEPQLLEKLGIVQRATRTPAQRHAGQKAAETRKAKKAEPELVGASK
ncbi:MAG: hypothetical protein ACHQHM_06135 [Thermoanaerobaculales bacterium]